MDSPFLEQPCKDIEISYEGAFYADSHIAKHHVQGLTTSFSEIGDIDFLYSEDKLRKYKLIKPRLFFLN